MSEFSAHFKQFHQRIRLAKTQKKRIQDAVSRLRDYIRSHSTLSEASDDRPVIQGSYRQRTDVLPVEKGIDFDVDVVMGISQEFVEEHRGNATAVLNAVEECFRDDSDYEDRVVYNDRCIRLDYEGSFHVDLTPAREAAEHREVPDRGDGIWLATNPDGFHDWVQDINKDSDGRFVRAMKYLKRWRDRRLKSTDRIPSVALTAFAGTHDPATYDGPRVQRLPLKTENSKSEAAYLTDLFIIMADCLDRKDGRFEIENPTLPGEDLARDWSWAGMKRFKVGIQRASERAKSAYGEEDAAEGARKWREWVFGKDFPLDP